MAERKKKPSRGLLDIIPEPAPEVPDSVQGGWLDAASYDPRMLSYAAGTGLRNMLEGTAALPGLLFDVARGGMQKIREMSPEGQRGSAAPFDTTTVDMLSEAARKAAEDPRAVARQVMDYGRGVLSSPGNVVQFLGENVSPRIRSRPTMAELDVYHGTPHRYAPTERSLLGEFDSSKIGTGEGAQAYGHGIYFAENPEVAKGYQPRDPKAEAKLMNLYKQAEARQNYDQMEVLEAAMLHRTANELRDQYPNQKTLINRIEKINEKSAGALYKADLPDEMIDRMLDWDKPIKDQPTVLQSIRATLPDDVRKDFDANVQGGISGGNAYLNWVWGAKSAAQKSEKLKEAGVPGIKYADAGSRGQGGAGTRNFVVFPGEEKNVRILERK